MSRRPTARRLASLALLLACLSAAPGCGLADPGARGRDVAQILHVGVGGSLVPGLHAWALAPLLGASLGYTHDSAWVGSDYGYALLWRQAAYGVALAGELVRSEFPYPVASFWRQPLWDSYLAQSQLMFVHLAVTDERLGAEAQTIVLRRAEVGLHLLFVGASLGVDLVHLFDAGAGLFGYDPSDDDGWRPEHAPFWRPDHTRPPPDDLRQATPPVDAPPEPWVDP